MPHAITIPAQHDLIAALATAPGAGAIAIVRIDGAGTRELIRALFKPAGMTHPVDAPRMAVFGRWVAPSTEGGLSSPPFSALDVSNGGLESPPPPDDVIDEGLTIFFPGPRSFTGNDLAELHAHGGAAVTRALLGAVLALGARSAEPGEFTRRAFLNGRIDLAQAEAVADLIAAQTAEQARLAQRQLGGGLSRAVEGIRSDLIRLAAELEARIDFPDEDLGDADAARLAGLFTGIKTGIENLLATRGRGRLLREGASAALIGPPNAGKSSLLNALARTDRAIVTPHPGTTRDTVECVIDLRGVPLTLIDTAGLRESEEPVERIGIERSRRAAAEAGIVIEVRDASGVIPPLAEDQRPGREPDLVVYNKIDLATGGGLSSPPFSQDQSLNGGLESPPPFVFVSTITGEGLGELEAAIAEVIGAGGGGAHEAAVSERHAAMLARAGEALAEARAGWDEGRGGELVMIDLREALAALDAITGAGPHEAILDEVFARFCLGK